MEAVGHTVPQLGPETNEAQLFSPLIQFRTPDHEIMPPILGGTSSYCNKPNLEKQHRLVCAEICLQGDSRLYQIINQYEVSHEITKQCRCILRV